LFQDKKDAVFMFLYIPGYSLSYQFLRAFEEASADPDSQDVVFMQVHCRKHINYCMNKVTSLKRIAPYAEINYLND
jgi:hypothetical protein